MSRRLPVNRNLITLKGWLADNTVTVTTQYSKGNVGLKEPRSVSSTIYIGGKPAPVDPENLDVL
ncbi:hypothetical protein [Parabacteroides sp. AM08-6]|uniref:hypothetical protein n=1 Tax=Parabacteroides sp. AM08-6 TaxID=2292053 RepID=UPI000EFFB561|nr:hypothetical protein [Parabacteroides sp. AM08-6]RHJ84889.1 hypothetical protein DW103_05425 [Parabacteroides sp. AM08-6]